jgi:four helix bundle protein
MPQDENSKRFDLEDRTFAFAKSCRGFVKTLTKTVGNIEDARQLVRASGSVGANYIEANEALSKKDFIAALRFAGKRRKKAGTGFD